MRWWKSTGWLNDSFSPAVGCVSGDLTNPQVGNDSFLTFTDELGYAIGFDHMGEYNGGCPAAPSSHQDSLVYFIMSYFSPNSSEGGQALGVA